MNDTYFSHFLELIKEPPTESLVSRLKERLHDGLMIYKQQWKRLRRRALCIGTQHRRGVRQSDCTWVVPKSVVRQHTSELEGWVAAQLAGWATPRVSNNSGTGSEKRAMNHKSRLGRSSFLGATAREIQLNPAFSRWLTAESWCEAAIQAISIGCKRNARSAMRLKG